MIKKIKFRNFILKDNNYTLEMLNDIKDKIDKSWQESFGSYYKVLEVEIDEIDIKESIVTVESWDIKEFSPAHAYGYSCVSDIVKRLKENCVKTDERGSC